MSLHKYFTTKAPLKMLIFCFRYFHIFSISQNFPKDLIKNLLLLRWIDPLETFWDYREKWPFKKVTLNLSTKCLKRKCTQEAYHWNFSLEKLFSWKRGPVKKGTNVCFCEKKCLKQYFQNVTEKGIVSNKTFWNFFETFSTNKSSSSQNDIALI